MSNLLFIGTNWRDQNVFSPPVQWELTDTSRFTFEQDGDLNPNATFIDYIGTDPLPEELKFQWAITTAATNGGTFTFWYKIGILPAVSTPLGSAVASGEIIVNPAPGEAFAWGVGTGVNGAGIAKVNGDESLISFNCKCEETNNNETLLTLRTRMMRRLGFSAQAVNPPPGMADLLTEFLRDAQTQAYRSYAALRTERIYRWVMTVGTRYYDIDGNADICDKKLEPYRLTWVGVEDQDGAWRPMSEGIRPELYSSVSSTGMPARYEVRQCIEVFPAPDKAYTLRVKGHFGLQAFSADGDKTTINSDVVYLLALANAKAHYRQPDAQNVFGQADTYIGRLVGGSHGTRRYIPTADPALPQQQPRLVAFDED